MSIFTSCDMGQLRFFRKTCSQFLMVFGQFLFSAMSIFHNSLASLE